MNKKDWKNLTGFYSGAMAHEIISREIFSREASAENFLTRDFFTGGLPRKISHVRFFHGKPPQKIFSREIFSREASPAKNRFLSRLQLARPRKLEAMNAKITVNICKNDKKVLFLQTKASYIHYFKHQ
jgi:hypothetical protein